MINKFIISICINVLVGILFAFPVFSAHNISNFANSKKEQISLRSQICIDNFSRKGIKTGKNHFKKDYIKLFSAKKYQAGKVTVENFSPAIINYFHQFYSDLTITFKKNLFPLYINIAFLTELKIIKMLC